MRSGDRPGLQNRRVASDGVTDGFDSHSLPPFFLTRSFDSLRSLRISPRGSRLRSRRKIGSSSTPTRFRQFLDEGLPFNFAPDRGWFAVFAAKKAVPRCSAPRVYSVPFH